MSDHTGVEIREDTQGAASVISPTGDIDMSGSPALRESVRRLLGGKPQKLVVDLTDVGYMDSSGLATLVEAMKIAKGTETMLILCAMNDRVRAIFEIARLDQYFNITDSLDTALSG